MPDLAAEIEATAEWLGDMSEAYNVTDYTDDQRIVERIAARQAEVLRTAAAEIGSGPTVRVLVERESCDWWQDRPVADLLRERANAICPPGATS